MKSIVIGVLCMAAVAAQAEWNPGLRGGYYAATAIGDGEPETVGYYLDTIAATNQDKSSRGLWTNQRCWKFWGEIYLPEGNVSYIGKCDDRVQAYVDGVVVLDAAGTIVTKTYSNASAGWHSFKLLVWENTGNTGGSVLPGGVPKTCFALQFGDGAAFYPVDDGTMNIYRYDDGLGFKGRITVSGLPAIGSPYPAYGENTGFEAGRTYAFHNDATVMTADTEATCLGAKVYRVNPDGTRVYVKTYNGASFDYEHPDCETALEWIFSAKFKMDFDVGGGKIAGTKDWYAIDELISVTVTAPEGKSFFKWTGDVPEGCERDNPLVFAADRARKLAVQYGDLVTVAVGDDVAACVAAAPEGSTVEIAPGTHSVTAKMVLDRPITIVGMGATPGDTVLKQEIASGNDRRIFVLQDAEATVKHLTLHGGYCNVGSVYGGNAVIEGNGGRIVDCVIRNGYNRNSSSRGGGVYLNSDQAFVDRCVITNNDSNGEANFEGGSGVGIAKGRVSNSFIGWNSVPGIVIDTSSDKMRGAVWMSGGELVNCTVAFNRGTCNTAGVYCNGGRVYNTLIYANRCDGHDEMSDVFGGESAAFFNCLTDVGQINDTCFTLEDAGFSDFPQADIVAYGRQRLSSPAIDGGRATEGVGALDLNGNPRVCGSAVDIGAVEYQTGATDYCVSFDYTQPKPYSGNRIVFTVTERNGTAAATFDYGDNTSGTASEHVYAAPGAYAVTVTADGKGDTRTVYVRGESVWTDKACKTPAAPFATPETATADFHEAVRFALTGDTVEFPAKTQSSIAGPYIINKGVTVKGQGPTQTRFDRQSNYFVKFVLNHPQAMLHSVELYGGQSNQRHGVGVAIGSNGGCVSNCVMRDANGDYGNTCGSQISIFGPGLATHCIVTNNSFQESSTGGQVALCHSGARVENCLIAKNRTWLSTTVDSRMKMKACAGVYMSDGTLANCTIVGNRSLYDAGVYATGGQVVNCIISGNTYEGKYGGETSAVYDGDPSRFVNCISDEIKINDTCVKGNTALAPDFRLTSSSSAIDAGTTDGLELHATTDLAGKPRITRNGLIDIGCYEFEDGDLSIAFVASAKEGILPLAVTLTATARSAVGAVDCRWDFGDGRTDTGMAVTHVFETAGDFTVSVLATDSVGIQAEYTLPDVIKVRQRTIYAKADNPDAALPYATPDTGAATLAAALAWAVDGCEVILLPGTYPSSRQNDLSRDIIVRGATGRPEDVIVHATSAVRNFKLSHTNAFLHSLTVENGCSPNDGLGGGNVCVTLYGGTVSNCVIRNGSTATWDGANGSGACLKGGLLTHCVVTNNWNTREPNYVGGVGVSCDGGAVRNCLVAWNYSTYGSVDKDFGALRLYAGAAVNCTVVSNSAPGAGGIYAGGGGVTNCIIAMNVANKATGDMARANVYGPSTAAARFVNCVTDGLVINGTCGAGDLAFKNAAARNYRLTSRSAARDAGTDAVLDTVGELDLSHRRRKAGPHIDAGCYEYLDGLSVIIR